MQLYVYMCACVCTYVVQVYVHECAGRHVPVQVYVHECAGRHVPTCCACVYMSVQADTHVCARMQVYMRMCVVHVHVCVSVQVGKHVRACM